MISKESIFSEYVKAFVYLCINEIYKFSFKFFKIYFYIKINKIIKHSSEIY